MRKNRPRNHRIPFAIADSPNFPTVLRVVAPHKSRPRTDHLRHPIDTDRQRRTERKWFFRRSIPRSFPTNHPRRRIQSHDKRILRSVAVKNQFSIEQNRRAPRSMDRRIAQLGLTPEHFPLKIQGRRPHMPKMHIKAIVRHNRRTARRRILRVHLRHAPRIRMKDLGIPNSSSIRGI